MVSVGCLGVAIELTLEVVPFFRCRNIWIPMPIERMLAHFGALVGAGGREPLCDSFSILPFWPRGVCSVLMKNFLPHAPRRPARLFAPRSVSLAAVKAQTLDSTARSVGVVLRGEAVAAVAAGSMAGEAGVAEGWALTAVEALPSGAGGDGRPRDGAQVKSRIAPAAPPPRSPRPRVRRWRCCSRTPRGGRSARPPARGRARGTTCSLCG